MAAEGGRLARGEKQSLRVAILGNGLNLSRGNLSHFSGAGTRLIAPENLTGDEGRGGVATEGTGAIAPRELGRCMGWGEFAHVTSLAVSVCPASAFNCCGEMPFHSRTLITLEINADEEITLHRQITHRLTDLHGEIGRFHAE